MTAAGSRHWGDASQQAGPRRPSTSSEPGAPESDPAARAACGHSSFSPCTVSDTPALVPRDLDPAELRGQAALAWVCLACSHDWSEAAHFCRARHRSRTCAPARGLWLRDRSVEVLPLPGAGADLSAPSPRCTAAFLPGQLIWGGCGFFKGSVSLSSRTPCRPRWLEAAAGPQTRGRATSQEDAAALADREAQCRFSYRSSWRQLAATAGARVAKLGSEGCRPQLSAPLVRWRVFEARAVPGHRSHGWQFVLSAASQDTSKACRGR